MRKIRGNVVGTTMAPEKIAERIGGGGGSAIAPLIVTLSEGWFEASHNAIEIYNHVKNGGAVYLDEHPDSNIASLCKLQRVECVEGYEEDASAEFSYITDEQWHCLIYIKADGSVECFEKALAPGTLIVTIQEDGKASHTALQIYDHVQAGGEVFLNDGSQEVQFLAKLSTIDHGVHEDGQEWAFASFSYFTDENFAYWYGINEEGTAQFVEHVNISAYSLENVLEYKFHPITQDEYDALVAAGEVDESVYYMLVG